MKCCIYLRKSRADENAELRGEGETLARHENMLLEVAKRQSILMPESNIYREVVSGETIASRPVMQRLLSEVECGTWDAVLVVEIERLARGDTLDQGLVAQTFKYSSTKIITPTKTYDPNNEHDEEFFEFGLFMSRREYKTINRRLQAGRVASVKEGKYVGNIPPYGYTRKKLDKQKGYTLEPHPDQAPVVRMVFDLYVNERIGINKITRRLNDLSVPATRGVWTLESIRGMIRNPIYIGQIKWNGRPAVKKIVDGVMAKSRPRAKKENWIVTQGLHEPIVDTETFRLANELIDKNPTRPNPRGVETSNPLAGLIICGLCGRKMVMRPYTLKGKPSSLICPPTSCRNISTHLFYVEDAVLEFLKILAERYKAETDMQKIAVIDDELLKRAQKENESALAELKKQLGNVHDLLERGVYDLEKFLERSNSIKERIAQTETSIGNIKKELENIERLNNAKNEMLPKLEMLFEVYETLTPAEKNDLLKGLIEKAVYTKSEKYKKFDLKIYPKHA
jgi:DNA invertase Pin-like site-specific DNA recombinase